MKHGTETTADPARALTIAFDEALPRAAAIQEEGFFGPFNEVWSTWGGKSLYHGPEPVLRELVAHNLERFARLNGFRYFRVDMRDKSAVQINAFLPNTFVPVQLYKWGDQVFTSGSDRFELPQRLEGNPQLAVETTDAFEREQSRRSVELVEQDRDLRCTLCGNNWKARDCGDLNFGESFVIWTCPECRVRRVTSL